MTEEEELLWSRKGLGGDTTLNLNLTVIYLISQQFGTRGCQEHHQVRVKHLKFVNCPCTGTTEYVEWVEGPTARKVNRRITQRTFATSDSRCPVRYLESLISKRPQHLRNSGPLYLQPLSKPKPDIWYSIQPVGINKIDGFMKKIATIGRLDITIKHFTNHSVRKTTVRKLQKAGVSNDKIIAITGHKTEQSIKAYVDTDLEDHRHISMLLSNKPLMKKPMSANVQYHIPLFHSLGSTIVVSIYTLGAHAVHHRPILKSVTCAVQPRKKRRIIIRL